MVIFRKALPRRTFLRGAGAVLALPLLDGMVPAFVSPTNVVAKPVARMGIVYAPMGVIPEKWVPTAEGAGYELTETLQPLAPFREHMLVLTGLDNRVANMVGGENGGPHSRPSGSLLTGIHPKPSAGGQIHIGISSDQIAARELGKHTQLASLEMALEPPFPSNKAEGAYPALYLNTISYRNETTPMPMEDKPRQVFERLFGDTATTDSTARRALLERDRSLLDSFTDAVTRLQKDLGPADRVKLNEYLDSVRDIERRVQIAEEQSSRELPTLAQPGGGLPATYTEYAKLMLDLQLLALQTDMTRVSTFMFGRETSGRSYVDIGISEAHHPITHHRNNPVQMEKVFRINQFHLKLFAYYLDKLRSTPDGDGSLLDHSAILYGSGLSNPDLHLNENLPLLLVGGGAGKIKGGRHLRFPTGTPLTNLHLAMLDIVGVHTDKLGDSTGELNVLSL